MNSRNKKISKFLQNPGSLRFREIHNLLISFGFDHIRASGSHNFYQNITTSDNINILVHNNDCKIIYKKQVAKLLENYI